MSRIVEPTPDNAREYRADHPDKLPQGDDEDYVEYLTRQGEAWTTNPPAAPEGFYLIECGATPRHWPMYTPVDSDFYEGPCPSCTYDALSDAHSGCEHSHHKAWRRWKITGKLGSWLYVMGITSSGSSWRMGGGCPGCYTMPKWDRRRRVYVLGKRIEWWGCLLRRRHFYVDAVHVGLCTKCFPCPDCGSTGRCDCWGSS